MKFGYMMTERKPFERFYQVEVAGAIGRIVFTSVPMSYVECKDFWENGIEVPMELWPKEVWWDESGIPRHGDEALGVDF